MKRRKAYARAALVLSLAGLVVSPGCGTPVGIAASPAEIFVEVGGSTGVNVVGVLDNGSVTAVSAPLTITSSDDAIATVSGEIVTGVAEGTANLTITDGVFTTAATVNVVAAGTLPSELVVTPNSISCNPASEQTQLEVFAIFAGAGSEEITERVSYSSSDTDVALVTTTGSVVCVGEGEAVISTQYLGRSDSVGVVVAATPPHSVYFPSPTLTCGVGETYLVQVFASWQDGSTTDVTLSALYSSSNTSITTASLGLVQCLDQGSATVVADVLGVVGVLQVNVDAAAVDPNALVDLRINPASIACALAGSPQFAVIAEFGDGRTADVTNDAQTQYQIGDRSIALLLDGQVVCIQRGQTTLQATYGGLVASATVNVQ